MFSRESCCKTRSISPLTLITLFEATHSYAWTQGIGVFGVGNVILLSQISSFNLILPIGQGNDLTENIDNLCLSIKIDMRVWMGYND